VDFKYIRVTIVHIVRLHDMHNHHYTSKILGTTGQGASDHDRDITVVKSQKESV